RPRVAVGVIHEVLGLNSEEEGNRDIGMAGARKVLAAHGFDSRDVILKIKLDEVPDGEHAVLTFDESKYERLEDQIAESDADIGKLERELKALRGLVHDWKTKSDKELLRSDLARDLDLDEVNGPIRKAVLERILLPNLTLRERALEEERKERAVMVQEKGRLNVENLAEQRRITDLKAKLDRLLADCDLLVLPRMTLFNVARNDGIRSSLYRLDPEQVSSIK